MCQALCWVPHTRMSASSQSDPETGLFPQVRAEESGPQTRWQGLELAQNLSPVSLCRPPTGSLQASPSPAWGVPDFPSFSTDPESSWAGAVAGRHVACSGTFADSVAVYWCTLCFAWALPHTGGCTSVKCGGTTLQQMTNGSKSLNLMEQFVSNFRF